MGRADPFAGYTLLLRTIVWVIVPTFLAWQSVRIKRALHIFQLEGYKRRRFLEWCRRDPRRAALLPKRPAKKPLVMTDRAWRILLVALALCAVLILGVSGVAHLAAGAPLDLIAWALTTVAVFATVPVIVVAADILLAPVQGGINGSYMRRAQVRLREVDPRVVAVTGSFGKTSTKAAIAAVLEPAGPTLATPGSFNTPLGICRTINESLEPLHRFFVVEMGAYGEGQIAELCRFVQPEIAVLTAIGPAHLERFGSLDAVRRAKYEIVENARSDGVAIMNFDDPEVLSLARATSRIRVVGYGLDASNAPEIRGADVRTTATGSSLTLIEASSGDRIDVETKLLGRHAIGHLLGAVAVARAVGIPLEALPAAISRLAPVEHRLQVLDGAGGVTVIDDAYNSNPDGAAAAFEVLAEMPARKRIVVTPGMIELGPRQVPENERMGELAAAVTDVLVVVGATNRDALVRGAARAANGAEVVTVANLDEATARLATLLGPGDVVLFENDLPDQYES